MHEKIEQRMKELGINRSELARASELSPSYITHLLKGQRGKRMGVETARKLSKGLRVNVTFFFPDRSRMQKRRQGILELPCGVTPGTPNA
ncbi:MAG: helix-turn-helix transcriptional regulator [Pleurocapsa sp. SU_196_0]|nr:helix-turn-helix transcriptional regulator [Pleurocapsa sp. SU_196_0]